VHGFGLPLELTSYYAVASAYAVTVDSRLWPRHDS